MMLPSVSDFVYPLERGQTTHTVFTPYVIDERGVVRDPDPRDAQAPRLVWQLSEISVDQANQMTARLTAQRGNNPIVTCRVKADAKDRHGTEYTILKT